MKLLITIDFPPENGGIQRYLLERVRHIYNCDDIIISGSSKKFTGQLPCRIIQHQTFSFLNKKLNLLQTFFSLFSVLLNYRPEVIEAGNIYGAIPLFFLSFILKQCRYSVICHGQELLQLQKASLKSIFLTAVLRRSSQRLVVSKFTLTLLEKAGIYGKCSLVPPKIDLSRYDLPRNQNEKRSFNILSVGRFVPHKGHATLLEAAAMLPQSIQYKLEIAGAGPLYHTLQQQCSILSLTDRVFIVNSPSHNDIKTLYRDADLFIFPSLNLPGGVEGFGIVLLEAMAFGIAVIASDTGGIPEVVTPECALLVPPGDPESICKSIIKLYEQPLLKKQLARKAYERLKTHFSWDIPHENSLP
jgi:phosphatidylinositol alpha-1,6-mannosyltransferase